MSWQLSPSRGALKLLFLTQGPAHLKSTSWFDDILVEQVVRVFQEGFETTWNHPTFHIGGEPKPTTSEPVVTKLCWQQTSAWRRARHTHNTLCSRTLAWTGRQQTCALAGRAMLPCWRVDSVRLGVRVKLAAN